MKTPLTIVTAASDNHFYPLLNLCWMIARFEPAAKVVVWDLGMTTDEVKMLTDTPPFYIKDFTIRNFDFTQYPAYFNISVDAGQYAWKPVIVADTVAEFGGHVLWMDAGNFLRNPLRLVQRVLDANGIFTPATSLKIGQKTHPDTIAKLNTSALVNNSMRDACLVGINAGNPTAVSTVNAWKSAALDQTVIAPTGSSRRGGLYRREYSPGR